MSTTRFLTGITTTGTPHLGNYVGSIRPSVRPACARRAELLLPGRLPRADQVRRPGAHPALHAGDRRQLAGRRAGPGAVTFYRQSDIPEIPELTWLLTCVTGKGLLNRAHAYKASVDKNPPPAATRRRRDGRPVHVPGADGGRHPDVQGAQGAGGARPGPAHRDGARHGRQLQPPVWRALCAARGGDRRARGHPARPGRPQDEQELRQHHPAVRSRASSCKSSSAASSPTRARRASPRTPKARPCSRSTRPLPRPTRPPRCASNTPTALPGATPSSWLFERIDREIAPMRERYQHLMAHPARIETLLLAGADKARALATPFMRELRQAVGLRSLVQVVAVRGKPTRRQGRPAQLQAVPRAGRQVLLQARPPTAACCCKARASSRRATPARRSSACRPKAGRRWPRWPTGWSRWPTRCHRPWPTRCRPCKSHSKADGMRRPKAH
jgi:tryptophanyl-tRNA synthetase